MPPGLSQHKKRILFINLSFHNMPLYEPKQATLGGIAGRGYAFQKKTRGATTYHGVFFAEEEKTDHLEDLLTMDEVHFDGVFYKKLMGGNVSKRTRTCRVDVYHLAEVPAGERIDFKVLEDV